MMENNSEQDLQALMIDNSEVQNTSDKEEQKSNLPSNTNIKGRNSQKSQEFALKQGIDRKISNLRKSPTLTNGKSDSKSNSSNLVFQDEEIGYFNCSIGEFIIDTSQFKYRKRGFGKIY